MTIIAISRGSFSKGKEVAEKLADKLGYDCVARKILFQASQEHNIEEMKLKRALYDSPSVFDHFSYEKERYIAYIKDALFQHLQKDNVVYHGLAGHFFLRGLPHVLKVRIIADMEIRISEELIQEHKSEKSAQQYLIKEDNKRRKWSRHLYGIDTWDPFLYDLVIHISRLSADDAVEIIANAARLKCYQTTAESEMIFKIKLLEAKVLAILIDKFPEVRVTYNNGVIQVSCEAELSREKSVRAQIQGLLSEVEGVENVTVKLSPYAY
ncbi:MAG: cytidylate kinase-like family protein [SAR324 cluster bacterium]|nr:cytidylate kinase-like family protein [SAR324 cluster bacterium]